MITAIVGLTVEPEEACGLVLVAGGLKAIGWELVIFGVASGGAFGGITFTLTNGGFEFAQASAWRLFSKNLSMTTALRS